MHAHAYIHAYTHTYIHTLIHTHTTVDLTIYRSFHVLGQVDKELEKNYKSRLTLY